MLPEDQDFENYTYNPNEFDIETEKMQEEKSQSFSTLDEPVWNTLGRDLKRIGIKLYYVLLPIRWSFLKFLNKNRDEDQQRKILRDWDLWGPLVFVLVLDILLSTVAAEVFVIVWVGSVIVTLNTILLGGNISFFQSVCTLGYCVFPLILSALISIFWSNLIFRIVIGFAGFVWSMAAALNFMVEVVRPEKKFLAGFPVALFYFSITWLIIVQV